MIKCFLGKVKGWSGMGYEVEEIINDTCEGRKSILNKK